MASENDQNTEPVYVISIAARMVGLHAQTLRYYERAGLLSPSRSMGRQRIYSPVDVERLRRIKALTEDMGVNLAGAEVILRLLDRINELKRTIDSLKKEVNQLQTNSPEARASERRAG